MICPDLLRELSVQTGQSNNNTKKFAGEVGNKFFLNVTPLMRGRSQVARGPGEAGEWEVPRWRRSDF